MRLTGIAIAAFLTAGTATMLFVEWVQHVERGMRRA